MADVAEIILSLESINFYCGILILLYHRSFIYFLKLKSCRIKKEMSSFRMTFMKNGLMANDCCANRYLMLLRIF